MYYSPTLTLKNLIKNMDQKLCWNSRPINEIVRQSDRERRRMDSEAILLVKTGDSYSLAKRYLVGCRFLVYYHLCPLQSQASTNRIALFPLGLLCLSISIISTLDLGHAPYYGLNATASGLKFFKSLNSAISTIWHRIKQVHLQSLNNPILEA